MTTHCPKCNSLLMIVPSGAVCSVPGCGGLLKFFDRKGIEAAWKQKRLEALLNAVAKATQVEGQATSYTITGQSGEFQVETVINPNYIESKSYDIGKLQAHGMILAARLVKKNKYELCWFTSKNRVAEVDLWDVPTSPKPLPKATPPSPRDPNLARVAVARVSRQALKVLEQLREGPKTNRQLLDVAIRYGSRIHDLRKAGYEIEKFEDHATGLTTYKLTGEPNE